MGNKPVGLPPADDRDRTLFLSYRVSDTGPTATWLFDKFAEAYGAERVFLDHERLEGGIVWPDQLEAEAHRATVMLVLIGEKWLAAHDPKTFVRRLDQKGDWVRKEIETALGAGSLVVPLLVEGAEPLSREAFETVPSLAPLADLQTLPLRRKDWASDLGRLHELLAANGFVRRSLGGNSSGTTARPFTIPLPVADFTGRETEIAELERVLTSSNGRAAICAVNGMGGVGKSQLAFELAWHLAEHFPVGQVYLDLRGTAPEPLSPEAALADLIRAAHPDAKPPADLAGLKALYLQTWRGRHALAAARQCPDEAQVRDLVPPAPVAMLVTSRRQIVPEGGRMLRLDVLPEPQAIGLVREVLGTARTVTEEEAHELAQACGWLPLALRAAASFLLRRLGWTVAEYLAELRSRRIAALDKVETVLSLSLDRLADEDGELAQRFMLLGAFPAGFDVAASTAVWQSEPRATRDALDALADWSLVQVEAIGRYRLHDLVRDLVVSRAEPAVLDDARTRHAGHYGEVLARANNLYLTGGACVLQGLALFDAERANIEAGHLWAVESARRGDNSVRSYPAMWTRVCTSLIFVSPRGSRSSGSTPRGRVPAPRRPKRRGPRTRQSGRRLGASRRGQKGDRILRADPRDRARDRRPVRRGPRTRRSGQRLEKPGRGRKGDRLLRAAASRSRARSATGAARATHSAIWATPGRSLGEAEKAIGFYERQLAIAREIGDRHSEATRSAIWASPGKAWETPGRRSAF